MTRRLDDPSDEIKDDVRTLIDGGWREWDRIDRALARGELDEAGWYSAIQAVIVPAYVGASNPQGQSGHSGDAATWKEGRGFIMEAIDHDGKLLDVGCANGYLMETVAEWASEKGLNIEPYGVDLSTELVSLAQSRLPHWRDRFWVGNGIDWTPPFRFDFVHLQELEYVPLHRRRALVQHLVENVAAPSGRVIVGPTSQLAAVNVTERALIDWGCRITGKREQALLHPEVMRRLVWIDNPQTFSDSQSA